MKISESQLRKIIRAQLNEFRFPEKKTPVSISADIGTILDQALAGKHASGRPFPSWLTSSINEGFEEDFSVVQSFESIGENNLHVYVNKLRQAEKRFMLDIGSLSYWSKKEDKNIQFKTPYLELLRSILLFTGGSVATVRDPGKYDPSLSKKTDMLGRYALNFTPEKSHYEIAKNILTKLAKEKNADMNLPLYRGISLPEESVRLLKTGVQFNNWPISSWTSAERVAIKFSKSKTGIPIVIKVLNPQHGCKLDVLSAYNEEEESILGKKLIITDLQISSEFEEDYLRDNDDGMSYMDHDDYDFDNKESFDLSQKLEYSTIECEVIP